MSLCDAIREFFCGKPPMDKEDKEVKEVKMVPSCMDEYKKLKKNHDRLRIYTENQDDMYLRVNADYSVEEEVNYHYSGTKNKAVITITASIVDYSGYRARYISIVDEYFAECIAEMINNNKHEFVEEIVNISKQKLETNKTEAKQEAQKILCKID